MTHPIIRTGHAFATDLNQFIPNEHEVISMAKQKQQKCPSCAMVLTPGQEHHCGGGCCWRFYLLSRTTGDPRFAQEHQRHKSDQWFSSTSQKRLCVFGNSKSFAFRVSEFHPIWFAYKSPVQLGLVKFRCFNSFSTDDSLTSILIAEWSSDTSSHAWKCYTPKWHRTNEKLFVGIYVARKQCLNMISTCSILDRREPQHLVVFDVPQ